MRGINLVRPKKQSPLLSTNRKAKWTKLRVDEDAPTSEAWSDIDRIFIFILSNECKYKYKY